MQKETQSWAFSEAHIVLKPRERTAGNGQINAHWKVLRNKLREQYQMCGAPAKKCRKHMCWGGRCPGVLLTSLQQWRHAVKPINVITVWLAHIDGNAHCKTLLLSCPPRVPWLTCPHNQTEKSLTAQLVPLLRPPWWFMRRHDVGRPTLFLALSG